MEKVNLTPEPLKCSEKRCEEQPFFAYWPKGEKQFKFCCITHKAAIDMTPTVVYDDLETYRKKAKRKIYHKHFQEFLK